MSAAVAPWGTVTTCLVVSSGSIADIGSAMLPRSGVEIAQHDVADGRAGADHEQGEDDDQKAR